jgi:hypothetical protein
MAGCGKISSEAWVKPPKEILVYEAANAPNESQSGLALQRDGFINPARKSVKSKFSHSIEMKAKTSTFASKRRSLHPSSGLGQILQPETGSGSLWFLEINRRPF